MKKGDRCCLGWREKGGSFAEMTLTPAPFSSISEKEAKTFVSFSELTWSLLIAITLLQLDYCINKLVSNNFAIK
jgi:hypothetical protein